MSKLPSEDLVEWTLKQLDDLDEADDATVAWVSREPYRHRAPWGLSEIHYHLDNLRAAVLLAGHGLLNRLAWVKPRSRKTELLDRAAEYCADDARRIKALWQANKLTPPKVNDSAAEVAVERHVRLTVERRLRLTGKCWSDEERLTLADKVIRRLLKPSGPSRAERAKHPMKKRLRAN
jgi:hypothetical protein